MPEVETVGKIMGSLITGYNTIAIAIAFLVKSVGKRPDIYNKILARNNGFFFNHFLYSGKALN